MKTFILSLVALGWTVAMQAQNFQVQAVSGGEELSYAYIYLNGRVCGIADQNGAFDISRSKLHIGDTISASYVGARSAFVVYTKELANESGYTLELQPDQVLGSVEVTSKFNIQRFFNKNVRKRIPPDWWSEQAGHADVRFEGLPGTEHIRTDFFYGIIPTKDLKTETHTRTGITDTSSVTRDNRIIVYSSIFHPLWRAADAPYLDENADVNAGIILRYRGEHDGKRHFLIARHVENIENYQLLLIVDKETKEIESAELDMLYGSFSTHLSCKVDFRRQRLSFKDGQNRIAIYPHHIAGTMQFGSAGVTSHFELSDIRLKEYGHREQVAITTERDSYNAPQPVFRREALFVTD